MNNMNKRDLKKLSKSQLIEMLLKRSVKKPEIIVVDDTKPVPAPRTYKSRPPIPTPRKSVKQMVKEYENNIILPPLEFRDKPVPAPRTVKPVPTPRTVKPVPTPRTVKPVPTPRFVKPVPTPRTKIVQTKKAMKGYTKSYEISIKNIKDPLLQLQKTRDATAHHIKNTLTSMKGIKFIETIKVTFTKTTNKKNSIQNCIFQQSSQNSYE